MTDTYKDLDALVPTDKEVKLGGVKYTLPGDLPLEVYVRVNKAASLEGESEQEALDQMVEAMVDLFSWLYRDKPEATRIRKEVKDTLKSRGIRFNTSLIKHIYGEDVDGEVDVEPSSGPTN